MTYRNLLLHLNALPSSRHRIAAALDLAQRFDARIVGLAAASMLVVPYGLDMAPAPDLLAEWQAYLDDQMRKATRQFEDAARQSGVDKIETRVAESHDIPALTLGARYADLVIIGQPDPADKSADAIHVSPGEVVIGCPRPVLVVPYIGAPPGFGKTVLIAWNGSREACRAVYDALPLLKKAARVIVMAVNPVNDGIAHGDLPGADLATYLAHHDINVEVRADPGAVVNVGEELLSRIADLNVDLLVMGAYGHSRAREWVFGGATRTIMESMTVPVLMSH